MIPVTDLTNERLDELERQARSGRPMESLSKAEVLALIATARRPEPTHAVVMSARQSGKNAELIERLKAEGINAVERVLSEHVREDGSAGNGHTEPLESWISCSCGAFVWSWQQYYGETDEDPERAWNDHIALATLAALVTMTLRDFAALIGGTRNIERSAD